MINAFNELSLTREPYDTKKIKSSLVNAIPVVLGGTEKDPMSLKRKRVIEDSDNSDNNDDTSFQWLPPRTGRQIPPHTVCPFVRFALSRLFPLLLSWSEADWYS